MTNVNDPYPMPDAMQEFSVQTSNYDAEFGQSAGAVVNIVTKSGGEQFHGDLFEFLRNGFFNAESLLHTTAGQPASPSIRRRSRRSGDHPGLSSGKSTQFFYGYQHTIPTDLHRQQHGSHTRRRRNHRNRPPLRRLQQPLQHRVCASGHLQYGQPADSAIPSHVLYPYNHIPSAAFDQAAVNFRPLPRCQARMPAADRSATQSTISAATAPEYFNEYTARVDHQFGSKDHLFGRYFYDWYHQSGHLQPERPAKLHFVLQNPLPERADL